MSNLSSSGGALSDPESIARVIAVRVLSELRSGSVVLPEYFDTAQASDYLGMSQDWLAKARCEGYGPPYVKLSDSRGGAVRYRRADLDEFASERRVVPGGGR